MQRSRTSSKANVGGTPQERHRLFLGLALLLTVFAEVSPLGGLNALSTTITTPNDPSALQQLATFAALEEVAEEEDLDWGSNRRLGSGRKKKSTDAEFDASARHYTPTNNAAGGEVGDVDSVAETTEETATSSGSSATSGSRRRPHRRQRRRKGAELSTTASTFSGHSDAECGASSTTASLPSAAALQRHESVHNLRIWTQLHVMEVACSTRSNNFVHVTERFAEYQRMFPTVYMCSIDNVRCPAEEELLANPATGLASSRVWSCERCGRRHDAVREACQRCRAPSRYTKLFVGQAIKEADCAPSLIRLLHATHPEIVLHRVEGHSDRAGRGKGCASLYVDRGSNAEELIRKLNHNVFFDVNDATGELVAHYVYAEQREWLTALVGVRVGAAAASTGRPSWLPWNALVVEEGRAAVDAPRHPPALPQGRFHQQQQQQQQQQMPWPAAVPAQAQAYHTQAPPPMHTPPPMTFAL